MLHPKMKNVLWPMNYPLPKSAPALCNVSGVTVRAEFVYNAEMMQRVLSSSSHCQSLGCCHHQIYSVVSCHFYLNLVPVGKRVTFTFQVSIVEIGQKTLT